MQNFIGWMCIFSGGRRAKAFIIQSNKRIKTLNVKLLNVYVISISPIALNVYYSVEIILMYHHLPHFV